MLVALSVIVLYGGNALLIWLGLREAWRREKRRARFREWEQNMIDEEARRKRRGTTSPF